MESADSPDLQQTGLVKPSDQDQVEYAKARASRFLPGVSIVGQPAIDIRRADKATPVKQMPPFASQQARKSQSFTPFNWQSAPADSFENLPQNEMPHTFSIPQERGIPSLYQTPMARDSEDQSQSVSLLAHIANQICGGS
jgi:hypothetical protein